MDNIISLMPSEQGSCATRRKNPWLIWGIGAAFGFYQFLLQSSASVIAGSLGHEFGMTSFTVGFFASIYFYTYLALQIPAGNLLDKWGPRRLILTALPLTILACLLMSIVPNAQTAAMARFMMGFSTAPAVISGFYLAANWFSAKQYPIILGLTELICMLGGGLGQKFLSYSTEWWGWRISMVACAIAGIALLIAAFYWVEDKPKAILASEQDSEVAKTGTNIFKQIFGNRTVIACGLFAGFGACFIGSFAGMWGVPYLRTTYGISLSEASTGTALLFVGVGISSIASGYLSNYLGVRKPIMAVSMLLTLVFACAALYLPVSLPIMLTLLFLMGLSSGGYMLAFTVTKEILPQACQGAAIGFINMMTMTIGALMLQPLIGWLLSLRGTETLHTLTPHDYEMSMIVIPICLMLSLGCLPFIQETHCRSLQQHMVSNKGRNRSQTNGSNSFWSRRLGKNRKSVGE